MFLLVLNEGQSTAFLNRPWLSIAVGGTLTGIAALFGGLSTYLIAALILPLLECALRYGLRPKTQRIALLPAAVAVLITHAVLLAFMQGNAIGVQKLAVNIAYVFTIVVGTGVGGVFFGGESRRQNILNMTDNPSAHRAWGDGITDCLNIYLKDALVVNYILPVALLIIGAALAVRGSMQLTRSSAVRKWKEVTIEIETIGVDYKYDVIKYARLVYYFPVARYSYRIDGKVLQSRSVSLDKKGIWKDNIEAANKLAEEILAKKIAYLNPNDMTQSVLLPYVSKKRSSHYYSLTVSGLLLIGISIMFLMLIQHA